MVSQAQLLRPESGEAVLLFEGDQVLVVTEDQDAMVDRDTVPAILDALDLSALTSVGGLLTDLEVSQLSAVT